MRRLDPELERGLRQTLAQWRRLRMGEALAVLIGVLAVAWLLFGLAVWKGLVHEPLLAGALALALFLAGGAAFVVILVACLATARSRAFLSEHFERAHTSLRDRLNTLVWIDSRKAGPVPDSYRKRIESQAKDEIAFAPLDSPFSGKHLRRRWAISLALTAATLTFLGTTKPWTRLAAAGRADGVQGPNAEPNLKLPAPDDAAEIKKSWGEVRITEPGRDLKVTKVDVVPLQIEAASSETLKEAQWLTVLGADAPRRHPLPAPREPHYAVYKPLLYVDELRLSDWDVLTYHATATTSGARYASEVYFIEVRPFREDILKLAGGEGGAGYQFLSELTGLIDRQKHAIRETHAFLQRSYERAETRRQDRDSLAAAERDLAEAARHLYARIAARAENQDVAVVLDNLALAEEHLSTAGQALSADDPKAPGHERDALLALVATRKNLQKAISENAFGDGNGSGEEDPDDEPVAELPDKLKQISEFRDAQKAGRELLDRAVAEQRRILEKAERGPASERGALGEEQEALRRELADFAAAHPPIFRRAEKPRVAADEALRKAGEALRDPETKDAVAPPRDALKSLEALREAVRSSGQGRQLTQAYELKELLDAQAKGLSRVEAEPEAQSAQDLARKAQEARETTREMKKLVDETPVGDAFAGALEEALGAARQAERERKLEALPEATGKEGRKRAAREAREDLEKLSQAFEQSQPATVRALRKADALKEGDDEAFERGLRQLEGLVAEAEAGRPLEGEDAERRRRDILFHLRQGVTGLYGQDARTRRLLLHLEDELTKADLKADPRKLRKLLDEIEQFRVEMGDARLAREQEGALRHLDDSKLPPAYRERIQRYFQRLSEAPE